MTRKIFGLLLCIVIVNGVFAQDSLLTNRVVNARIQTGYFMQKVGTTIIDNDTCINRLQSKNSLWLDTTALPLLNYMPPNSKLVPLITIPCTSPYLLCATAQNADYSSCGAYIYSQGFNNTLTTYTRTRISPANAFWIGTTANCTTLPPTTASVGTTAALARTASASGTADSSAIESAAIASDIAASKTTSARTASVASTAAITAFTGPMNRAGVWTNCGGAPSSTIPSSQWVGIQRTITANATQTIYLGIGAVGAFRIIINSLTVVTYGTSGNVYPYKIWHIFPIQMGPGIHTLTIQAEVFSGSTGTFGVELYNNTPAEITAATSYSGLKLLFSTKDMVGKYVCP